MELWGVHAHSTRRGRSPARAGEFVRASIAFSHLTGVVSPVERPSGSCRNRATLVLARQSIAWNRKRLQQWYGKATSWQLGPERHSLPYFPRQAPRTPHRVDTSADGKYHRVCGRTPLASYPFSPHLRWRSWRLFLVTQRPAPGGPGTRCWAMAGRRPSALPGRSSASAGLRL